jgi:hypothetical protein
MNIHPHPSTSIRIHPHPSASIRIMNIMGILKLDR